MPFEALVWIKQLVKWTILPPNGPLIVVIAGLAVAARNPGRGIRIAWAGLVALVVLSTPITGAMLMRALDRTPALDLSKPHDAQAIVILGGGVRPFAAEYGGATLSSVTLERVRYGARVARTTGLPVLVSGGALRDTPAEALLMRNTLTTEFGVAVRWVEARSHNTHQNAVRSAAILRANAVSRVILVGHAFDFPRARNEFESAGISVVPAPIGIVSLGELSALDFVPGLGGLQRSYFACYELLANALYQMRR
jgi:uncharacterized SAM-binding protein YcdF (DUF218 family)